MAEFLRVFVATVRDLLATILFETALVVAGFDDEMREALGRALESAVDEQAIQLEAAALGLSRGEVSQALREAAMRDAAAAAWAKLQEEKSE